MPQRASEKLNLGVKELDGILNVKVGVNRDSHDSGHRADKGTLIFSRDIPEEEKCMNYKLITSSTATMSHQYRCSKYVQY